METYLAHHGILGMKWGVRRYQNEDGTLTEAGKLRSRKLQDKALKNYNKSLKDAKKRDQMTAKYATKKAYYARQAAKVKSGAYNSPFTKLNSFLGGNQKQRMLAKADALEAKGLMYQVRIDKWQARVDKGEALARKYLQKAERFDSSVMGASRDLAKWKVEKIVADFSGAPVIKSQNDKSANYIVPHDLYKKLVV